jgi:tetratricopeptide (TPR) repeat protein
VSPDPPSLLEAAERAVVLASVCPESALRDAESVLAASTDPAERSVAERGRGLAVKELGDVVAATRHLRHAVTLAERAGSRTRAGQARMSLAVLLSDRGQSARALIELDTAFTLVSGADRARVLAQRGLVLDRLGRSTEALASYRRALPLLRRAGDTRFEAGALLNRGTYAAHRGDLRAAEADLRACARVARAADLHLMEAVAHANLGFVALRVGDIPRALAAADTAESVYGSESWRTPTVWSDRGQALLAARLADDARREFARAIVRLEEVGVAADAAETQLFLARAALEAGDTAGSLEAASAAKAALRRQRRTGWAVLADHVAVRARWDAGDRSAALLRDARRCATKAAAAGWPEAALHSRIVAARVLLAQNRRREAARELDAARPARRRGPADVRAAAWHAEALLRLAHDDRRGAFAAIRSGLRIVDDHAASMGATDLRVHASGLGRELAELGFQLAIQRGTARDVLRWAERYRSSVLRRRPVRPPDDRELAAQLAELRRVTAEISEARAAGRGTDALRAEQVRLEQTIRSRSRHAAGTNDARVAAVDVRELAGALDDRVLVEYVLRSGQIHAVTVADGKVRLWPLGDYDEVLHEQESLRFSMHRLARRHGAPASLEAAWLGVKHAAARLDDVLLGPLRDVVRDRELVLVPTMALHALPWTMLPSLATRPVSVAPSAGLWLRANAHRPRRWRAPGPVLVAGPALEHAHPEVAELTARYRGSRVLVEEAATAEAVLGAMDGAELVHVAAHGRFRGDNPQFSCLELADGPLTVYDLERLRRAPRRLVLSACDSALSAVHPGDELMGLAAAVFALGTSTLIASVTPVPDDETRTLMVDLHERLAAGTPPARALAEAQQATEVDGFVCFGAG